LAVAVCASVVVAAAFLVSAFVFAYVVGGDD
jgi:hypothetical protein